MGFVPKVHADQDRLGADISRWPNNLAITVIVGLQHCSEKQDTPSAIAV
jgi:hypothetical protein